MAKFVKNKGLVQKITDVIEEAEEILYMVCPYYKILEEHLVALQEASNRRVEINLIYSKAELNHKELLKLKTIRRLSVFRIENLHAKCYANEKEVVLSTMNLHEYSAINNIEMGMIMKKGIDDENFSKAFKEIKRIHHRSEKRNINALEKSVIKKVQQHINPVYLSRKASYYFEEKLDRKHHGYCIRTGQQIPFNPNRPFSRDAYEVWNDFKNPYYEENYCHFSGESSNGQTSFANPILRKNMHKAERHYVRSRF